MSDVIVLGHDRVGVIAEGDGMRYYLTPCCGASAKGLEFGIGCRSCYREIDPRLGDVPDKGMTLVKGEKPEFGIRDDILDGWWTFVDCPIEWVEVYGDGLPYDEWRARATPTAHQPHVVGSGLSGRYQGACSCGWRQPRESGNKGAAAYAASAHARKAGAR